MVSISEIRLRRILVEVFEIHKDRSMVDCEGEECGVILETFVFPGFQNFGV